MRTNGILGICSMLWSMSRWRVAAYDKAQLESTMKPGKQRAIPRASYNNDLSQGRMSRG